MMVRHMILGLLVCGIAHANLGETEKEIISRYGRIMKRVGGISPHLGECTYHALPRGAMEVMYINGKSARERIFNNGAVTRASLEASDVADFATANGATALFELWMEGGETRERNIQAVGETGWLWSKKLKLGLYSDRTGTYVANEAYMKAAVEAAKGRIVDKYMKNTSAPDRQSQGDPFLGHFMAKDVVGQLGGPEGEPGHFRITEVTEEKGAVGILTQLTYERDDLHDALMAPVKREITVYLRPLHVMARWPAYEVGATYLKPRAFRIVDHAPIPGAADETPVYHLELKLN